MATKKLTDYHGALTIKSTLTSSDYLLSTDGATDNRVLVSALDDHFGLSNLEESVERNTTDLATAQTNITAAQTSITQLSTDLTTAQTDLTTAKEDIATAQEDITALKAAEEEREKSYVKIRFAKYTDSVTYKPQVKIDNTATQTLEYNTFYTFHPTTSFNANPNFRKDVYAANLIDASHLDTSKFTSLHQSFIYLPTLKVLDVSGWDVSKVTNFYGTFMGCKSLEVLDVGGWDTSSATDMQFMFKNCLMLRSLDLSGWDFSKVTSMVEMFSVASNLESVYMNKSTTACTSMISMFYNCSKLTTAPEMDTSACTNMQSMFQGCSSLVSVPEMDFTSCTNAMNMFSGCSKLTSVNIINTSACANMQSMFYQCSSLTTLPEMDTSNVTNMQSMFQGCSSLTTLPEMDTSNVTNMLNMFVGCSKLKTMGGLTGLATDLNLASCTQLSSDSVTNIIDKAATGAKTIKLATAVYNALTTAQKELAASKNITLAK